MDEESEKIFEDFKRYYMFFESEYFYTDTNGWHLKEGAPQEVVDSFNRCIEARRKSEKEGWY